MLLLTLHRGEGYFYPHLTDFYTEDRSSKTGVVFILGTQIPKGEREIYFRDQYSIDLSKFN